MQFVPGITAKQKRQLAEWSMRELTKLTNLKHTQMFWEEQGNYVTLRTIGQRAFVEAGEQFKMAFQARTYLGDRSIMTVFVGELAELSPSAEMENFLDRSVKFVE